MSHFLFICSKYTLDKNDPYLTNDLVNGFLKLGDKVTVIAFGDIIGKIEASEYFPNKTEIIIESANSKKYFKYFNIWFKTISILFKLRKQKNQFDKCIIFAPLSVNAPIVLCLGLLKIKKKICLIFDIFPAHHIEIEAIPKYLHHLLFYMERYLIGQFDVLTGMTPANKQRIEAYYKFKEKKRIEVLPLWGVRETNFQEKKKHASVNMVFGGQIVAGRSIEYLIEYILEIRKLGLQITLTIYSSGVGFEFLKNKCLAYDSFIFFRNKLKREEYIKTLQNFDVGAIITDPRVSSPTFPSKLIDYMNSGIPCFCIIEDKSDIESFINDPDFLHVNYFDTSKDALLKSIDFFKNLKSIKKTSDLKFAPIFKIDSAISLLHSF